MAPREEIESPTKCLTDTRSTIELPRNKNGGRCWYRASCRLPYLYKGGGFTDHCKEQLPKFSILPKHLQEYSLY